MSRAGFEPATPAGDRPQTLALDRSATGIGHSGKYVINCSRPNGYVIVTVQIAT